MHARGKSGAEFSADSQNVDHILTDALEYPQSGSPVSAGGYIRVDQPIHCIRFQIPGWNAVEMQPLI